MPSQIIVGSRLANDNNQRHLSTHLLSVVYEYIVNYTITITHLRRCNKSEYDYACVILVNLKYLRREVGQERDKPIGIVSFKSLVNIFSF